MSPKQGATESEHGPVGDVAPPTHMMHIWAAGAVVGTGGADGLDVKEGLLVSPVRGVKRQTPALQDPTEHSVSGH